MFGIKKLKLYHWVKSARIWSFSGSCFPAFGLNTKKFSVSLRIQSDCGKIPTRKTPNADTFHAVYGTLVESHNHIIYQRIAISKS